MNEDETKYKSLIQPIKDLAANWDIDIADCLSEYLDDLDGECQPKIIQLFCLYVPISYFKKKVMLLLTLYKLFG